MDNIKGVLGMKKKILCLLLIGLCTFRIGCPVHAVEEYDEWNYSEDYTEDEYYDENEYYNEYYYNEENDYTEENNEYYEDNTEYYYEDESEPLTEESIIEETSAEEVTEISVAEESVSEMPSEISEEKSVAGEVSITESSIAEESPVPEISEPKILNLAFTAPKEEPKVNRISGTALWAIVFVLTVFSIIFLPRTRGIEFIKDRYRYRKAKKITKRHIR